MEFVAASKFYTVGVEAITCSIVYNVEVSPLIVVNGQGSVTVRL